MFRKKYISARDRAQMGFLFAEGHVQAGGPALTLASDGILTDIVLTTSFSGQAADLNGFGNVIGTTNVIDDDCGWLSPLNITRPSHMPQAVFKFALQATSQLRFFAGMTNVNLAATNAAADPAGSFVGLQYDDVRDANFQFMVKDGVTQTLVDTGIPADTAAHYLVIDFVSASEVNLELLDASMARQFIANIAAGLPGGSTNMGVTTALRTLDAAIKLWTQYHTAFGTAI